MKPPALEDLYDLINCFENDIDPVAFDIDEDEELRHIPLSCNAVLPFNAPRIQYTGAKAR